MSTNPLYIDIHAIQTVPPSCINRDDTGSPKTARFGGVTRARVSSQAWKKAMRDLFATLIDEDDLGIRTKDAVGLIAGQITQIDPAIESDEANKLATQCLTATGVKVNKGLTGYLFFIAPRQVRALAELGVRAHKEGKKIVAKEAKAVLNVRERPTLNAVDISLFGRMVADDPSLNVDAAVQVAHALGVNAAVREFDYFTAMDDCSPEDSAGAGMIGTVEYMSSTLYRYATLDVCHLCENLGSAYAAAQAAKAFIEAFIRSMPTGKQNTFANRTLPDVVIVQLRDTQPVSLVGAFERPVYPHGENGVTETACSRLVAHSRAIDEAYGTSPLQTYVINTRSELSSVLEELAGSALPMSEVANRVANSVSDYLAACGYVGTEE